jgi:pimeloyl-ACP methyl ester carboxylesterase
MAVDGFELAYDRSGSGAPVVLLHGWPGDRSDFRALVPRLRGCQVVAPDLRGFGESDKHHVDPTANYTAAAQARSVAGLITDLGLGRPVVFGYDVGSRVAQALGRTRPELVRSLVITPPLPGVGTRVFSEHGLQEYWYQTFHRLPVIDELIDGRPDAVRAYLRHFWTHWSGPDFEIAESDLDHLVSVYGPPGAFTASLGPYRAGAGTVALAHEKPPAPADRIAVPATVLWPEFDPLYPRDWSDRLDEFFSDFRLRLVNGAGHFAPLEYPGIVAEEILAAV